jgi:hypothetical protein
VSRQQRLASEPMPPLSELRPRAVRIARSAPPADASGFCSCCYMASGTDGVMLGGYIDAKAPYVFLCMVCARRIGEAAS